MNNIHSSDEVEEGDGETVEGGDAVVESAPEGGMGPEIADESYGIDPIAGPGGHGGNQPETERTHYAEVYVGKTITLTSDDTQSTSGHKWSCSSYNGGEVTLVSDDGYGYQTYEATVTGVNPGTVTITHTYSFLDFNGYKERTERFIVTVSKITGDVTIYLYMQIDGDDKDVVAQFQKQYNNAAGYITVGKITIPRAEVNAMPATPTGTGPRNDDYGLRQYINDHREKIDYYSGNSKVWDLPEFNKEEINWLGGTLMQSDGANNYVNSGTMCWHLDGTLYIKSTVNITVKYVADGVEIQGAHDKAGNAIVNPYPAGQHKFNTGYDVSDKVPETIIGEDGREYTLVSTSLPTSGTIAGVDLEIIAYYTEKTYSVRYEWTGLPTEQPGGMSAELPTAPVDNSEYKLGESYEIDKEYTSKSTYEVLDDYGNVLQVYTFSGWNTTDGKIEKNEDVVVTGKWTVTESHEKSDYQHTVHYSVTGTAPEGYEAPADQTYAEKQEYTIEKVPANVEKKDEYDNVTETWTFSGWKDAEGNIVSGTKAMGEENVEYTGVWTYEKKELEKYHVTYKFTGLPESGEGLPTPPVDDTEYVHNQPIEVKYPEVTVYYEKDEDGNTVAVYSFGGWDIESGKIDNANVTINGNWKKTEVDEGEGVLTVKYVNESGAPIQEPYVQVFAEGESYDVNNKTIIPDAIKNGSDNYIYVSTEGATEGAMTKDGVEITVVYTLDNIGGGEDGKQPDGTADKDEAVIYYVAEGEGTVDPSFKKFTFEGEETAKEVTAASTASAKAGYHFDSWTHDGEAIEGAEATLGQSITVEAGKTYTFTASFAVNTSTAPTEPTDPGTTDPTDPGTDPTDPGTDPTDPGTDPTDPGTDPTDPGTDPTDPGTDPTDPGTDPTDPGTDPTDPDDPDDPDDPPTPPAPVNPDNPGGPDDPAGPADPAGPNDPAGPGGPDAPEGPQDEVNIDDEGVPLASLPSQAAAAQQDYVVNEEAEIADNDTPLAGMTEVRCCILHFLIMVCALAVTVYYTHDRKRRQEQEFEVRSELAH